MPNQPLPQWYTPEQPPVAAPQPGAATGPLPNWYQPETEAVTVTAQRPDSWGKQAGDFIANLATGLLKVPGAVLGLPHLAAHTGDWIAAQGQNAWYGPKADGSWRTGADLDQNNLATKYLPTSEDVDKFVQNPPHPHALDFLFNRVDDPSQPAQFYEPKSFIGNLVQSGVTGAATGGAGLLNKAKMAAAAMGANATAQAFPDEPGLAAAAGLLAHAGTGAGVEAATRGYRTFAEPIVRPVVAGEALAGKSMGAVDNTQPGMAAPTTADLDAATNATRAAVGDIGNGLDDFTAGGNIRADLQKRSDAITAGRKAQAGVNYDAFRGEQPLEGTKLAQFMSAPTFRRAIKAAADGALDRGDSPLTDFWDFNEAGDPVLRPNAAVPPDILQRVKGGLDDAVESAKGNVARGDATSLRDRFVKFLDSEYPNTYPKAREDFADASRPLDPLTTGLPGKTLDSTTQFGKRTYTFPQDKIPGAFLQSKALRTDYQQLIDAYGGDKQAALSNLEENLAGKVQGAIKGDGTLSLDAFNRAIRPYTGALQMWFPQLAQKFSSAEAAQKTFETLTAQHGLAADIAGGALRDNEGFVTKTSLNRWLDQNEGNLAKTQPKGAVKRLRQIAEGLPDAPGGASEAAVELAPTALGTATGGLEGGVLGAILHKTGEFISAPSKAKFREAYSSAIEKAVRDPGAAQQLVAQAAKRGGKQSLWKVLKDNAAKAALAAPLATNAGAPGAGQ